MKRRLLLPLSFALSLSLGAECSDGGSGRVGTSSTASHMAFATEAPGVIELDRPGAPVPEPSAALVFGVGLLIAGALTRRRR